MQDWSWRAGEGGSALTGRARGVVSVPCIDCLAMPLPKSRVPPSFVVAGGGRLKVTRRVLRVKGAARSWVQCLVRLLVFPLYLI